jgi:hypothetical protein
MPDLNDWSGHRDYIAVDTIKIHGKSAFHGHHREELYKAVRMIEACLADVLVMWTLDLVRRVNRRDRDPGKQPPRHRRRAGRLRRERRGRHMVAHRRIGGLNVQLRTGIGRCAAGLACVPGGRASPAVGAEVCEVGGRPVEGDGEAR